MLVWYTSISQPKIGNWIKTVAGKGWFPIFRFYSPAQPFFDKSWKFEDITPMQ